MEANKIIITGAATRMGAAIAKKLSGPKVKHYSTNNKIYPKGRSTMGLPGTRAQKGKKKWKQIK